MSARLSSSVLFLLLLTILTTVAVAQAPPPGVVEHASPSDYALLERDLRAGMSIRNGIEAEAKAMALGYTDAQGNFVREDSRVMSVLEGIVVDADEFGGYVQLHVVVFDSPERAIGYARQHYGNYGTNRDWMVNANELGDPRITANGGSVVGPARVMIRYRDVVANIEWMGGTTTAVPIEQQRGHIKTLEIARLWLKKIAGPPGADLSVHPDRILVKLWVDHPLKEREPAADKQYVGAQVNNKSADVVAKNVQARLSVQMPGKDEYTPVQVVSLNDIAAGGSKVAVFEWDLHGQNVTDAGLLVDTWADGPRDTNPNDNQAGLEVSVYYAHNGTSAYRWREDSYSFPNYSYGAEDFEGMVEGLLATVIGQMYTDPQAGELLSRMLFPQTYTRFVDYLHHSVEAGAGGHCYGISATAGLYFMDSSLRPKGGNTSGLSKDAADPNIKLYQRAQMVPVARALLGGANWFERNWNSLTCLNTVRQKLRDERRPVIISISGTQQVQEQVMVNGQAQQQQVEKRWGHALMAYKLVEVNGEPSVIYVYDPNIAPTQRWGTNAPMSAFRINPNGGGWSASSDMSAIYQQGSSALTGIAAREVTREISVAESNALVPELKTKLREMSDFLAKTNSVMAVLRCPADVVFTDPQGRRVGYSGGRQINEIPGAEIRASGAVEIYILPAKVPLTVSITGNGSGAAGFDIIRPQAGKPAITSFLNMPVSKGTALAGTVAPGGEIAVLAGGGRTYGPTLVGSLAGDSVTWQKPPTPAPVAKPVPVAKPTPTPTQPAPAPAPKPTPAPAPKLPDAHTEVIICEAAPGGQPQNVANDFTAPKRVTALLKYSNLPANTSVKFVWTRDGKQQAELEKVLAKSGWQSHSITSQTALTPGRYHLSVLVDGRSVAERDITVRAAATAQTTSTPAPAAQAELIICRDVVGGEPVGPTRVFGETAKVAIFHRYQGQAAGTAQVVWLRNGAELTRSQREIGGGNGWVSFSLMGGGGKPLSAGPYEVVLTMPGRPALRATFTIGGGVG